MMLAARGAFLAAKSVIDRAMSGRGGSSGDCFYCSLPSGTRVDRDLTITMWMRPNSYPTHGAIFDYGGASSDYAGGTGFGIGVGGSNKFEDDDGRHVSFLVNSVAWIGSRMCDYSGWHHYALALKYIRSIPDRSVCALHGYFDGVLIGHTDSVNMLSTLQAVSVLGYFLPAYDMYRFLDGQVTRVCMYDSTFTSSQIGDEYRLGLTRLRDFSGVLHYWDGSTNGAGRVIDHVGEWHLSSGGDATVVRI